MSDPAGQQDRILWKSTRFFAWGANKLPQGTPVSEGGIDIRLVENLRTTRTEKSKMLTVESKNARFIAEVEEVDDGVSIAVWARRKSDAPGGHWRRIHYDVVETPFHCALDAATDLVNQLTPEVYHQRKPKR